MYRIFLIFFLIFSFCFSEETKYIHWNTVSFPPALISKGELKNQGYFDIVRNEIIKDLNFYKHVVEFGNSKLALTNLKRLKNGCFSGLNMNKKRKKFIHFSQPIIYSLPNEITIKKSSFSKFKKYLTSNNEMDLLKLLRDDALMLGYVDSRAYNSYVDELLEDFKLNKKVFARKSTGLTKGLLQMLARSRVDYIIEYPTMVTYHQKKYEIDSEFFHFPIKNASEVINVYVGCSKTKVGNKIISDIDEVIKKKKNYFMDVYKKWVPRNALKRYNKVIKLQ